jgi:general secretion pathway protein D
MATIKNAIILTMALVTCIATAQFDFGGGATGPNEPWKKFKLNPKTRMKLDFKNANVDMVLSLFSKTSGVTIVKDPSLTGPITITSAKPLPLNDAFEVLSATLKLKGFELTDQGKMMIIRNTNSRNNQGGRGGGGGGFDPSSISPEMMQQFMGGNSVLKVYPIQYANAAQVARVLNDVFAQAQDPMQQFLQQMMQQGGNRNQPQGRGGRPQGFGGGGFGGRGGTSGQTVRASSDDFSNTVIVNAPQSQQASIESIIKQIDKQTEQPLSPKVFKLEFAIAQDISAAVQNVLTANAPRGRGGSGNQQVPIEQRFQAAFRLGNAQAAFGSVVAEPRTNSLIVTATDDNLKLVESVIKELDVDIKMESTTFVFPLMNARADQIAQLMNQAFGARTGTNRTNTGGTRTTGTNTGRNNQQPRNNGGGGGGFGGGTSEMGMTQAELEAILANPDIDNGTLETNVAVQQGGFFGGGGQQNRPATQQSTGRDAQGRLVPTRDLTNQITVIPDQNTNSLIVVTSPENLELIRQIFAQLDKIPEQVMIETLIVEATLDSSTKLGVEWDFSSNKAGLGHEGGTGFGVGNANPEREGFKYTIAGNDFSVFVNALKTDQKFHVLSTPRIFTSNNSEASINISQRVPYVLSSREDPNGNLTFTYAFQDVGIVLTVTPRITSNGYVTMDINQQANDLQGFTSFNAPIINQRQADTTVSVKDGETIILGGIIRNTISATTKKVPLLGDIPLLGELFKSTDKQNVKTELLVFLTPRVVRDPEEAKKLREEQLKNLSKQTKESVNKAGVGTSEPVKTGGGGVKPPRA